MSALRDRVRELWNNTQDERRLDVIVDVFTEAIETLRAELEAVRSRRLAQCPVCAGSCTRKYADDSWGPCDHCNGAGVIFVDKEVKS